MNLHLLKLKILFFLFIQAFLLSGAPLAFGDNEKVREYEVGEDQKVILEKSICLNLISRNTEDLHYRVALRSLQDYSEQPFRFHNWYQMHRSAVPSFQPTQGDIWIYSQTNSDVWVGTTQVEIGTSRISERVTLRFYQFPKQSGQWKQGRQLIEKIATEAIEDLNHILNAGFYFPLNVQKKDVSEYLNEVGFKMYPPDVKENFVVHEISFQRMIREQDPISSLRKPADISGDFLFSWLQYLFEKSEMIVNSDMERSLVGRGNSLANDRLLHKLELSSSVEVSEQQTEESNQLQIEILRQEVDRRRQSRHQTGDSDSDEEQALRQLLRDEQ